MISWSTVIAGWIALGEGKYKNIHTGYIMDENGTIFNQEGEIVSKINDGE
jgi:hypothetical protein